MNPVVSVIIPCFNGAQYLAEAVESVLTQTFTNFECIIVDDGSTDETRQVSESLMSRDSRVKYLFKNNGGVASARNFGVRQAQGEWVQFLDGDDWLHKNKIKFQLNYLNSIDSGDEVVFYSDYELVYQNSSQNIVKRITNISGNMNNEQLLERAATWALKPDFPAPIWSLLIKKTVFRKKMMNEHFRLMDDLEFIIDILFQGVPFVYTPIVGVFYRKHTFPSLTKMPRRTIRDDYIFLLESMYKMKPSLLHSNPNITGFIVETFKEKDITGFYRLIKFIDTEQELISFANGKVKIRSKALLKLAFLVRLFVPIYLIRAILKLYTNLKKLRTKSLSGGLFQKFLGMKLE